MSTYHELLSAYGGHESVSSRLLSVLGGQGFDSGRREPDPRQMTVHLTEIGSWVDGWILRHRLTYGIVGGELGVSAKTISRWFRGQAVLGPEALDRLLKMVADRSGADDANALADLCGRPRPVIAAPTPPVQPAPPVGPTKERLGATLLLYAEHLGLPPRELRLAVHRMIAAWSEQGWSMEQVREALDGLDHEASGMAPLSKESGSR